MSDIGIREAAREIGVSHGTLSRIERGEAMEGTTLAKVLGWLMSPEQKGKK
jgi:DNA-binding XRE family transcriptional regulator